MAVEGGDGDGRPALGIPPIHVEAKVLQQHRRDRVAPVDRGHVEQSVAPIVAARMRLARFNPFEQLSF